MKKVFLTAMMAAAFVFGMAACNGNKTDENATDTMDTMPTAEQPCCQEHQCNCADTLCAQNHCEGCQDTLCCNPNEKKECCGQQECCKKDGECCKNKENK